MHVTCDSKDIHDYVLWHCSTQKWGNLHLTVHNHCSQYVLCAVEMCVCVCVCVWVWVCESVSVCECECVCVCMQQMVCGYEHGKNKVVVHAYTVQCFWTVQTRCYATAASTNYHSQPTVYTHLLYSLHSPHASHTSHTESPHVCSTTTSVVRELHIWL